jgi:hypothetical protein
MVRLLLVNVGSLVESQGVPCHRCGIIKAKTFAIVYLSIKVLSACFFSVLSRDTCPERVSVFFCFAGFSIVKNPIASLYRFSKN